MKPQTIMIATILLSGLCLSNSTWDLNQTVYNASNVSIDLTPLLEDMESICQIMLALNDENVQQTELLSNLSYNLENYTDINVADLDTNISLIYDELDSLQSQIDNTTTDNDFEARISDIENLYVTTGVLKTHNDTIKTYISENTQEVELTYIYLAILLVFLICVGMIILSQPKKRGDNIGKNPLQPVQRV